MIDSIQIRVNRASFYTPGAMWLPLLFLPKYWIDQESAAQREKVLLCFHQGKSDTLVSQVSLCLNSVDLFALG